ncbi:MAG: hypothetical protein HOW97_31005 [Catenulispora sp.]|nr:hypothetical protein [Catenulispora sp.]
MTGRAETTSAQRLLGCVLRLYPKGYRHQQGSELSGTYTAATAGAGRLEVLREAFDLAAHGLRVRLGLTSDRYAGAVLAAAVPYVAGSIAGLSGYMLYLLFGSTTNAHHEEYRLYRSVDRYAGGVVMKYSPVPVLVVAIALVLAVLLGWRSWTRWLALATVVTAAVTVLVVFELRRGDHIFVMTTFPGFELPLMLLAFALMVLAVPTDAASFTERRTPLVVTALAVAAVLHLAWIREGFAWSLITAMPGLVAGVLVLALGSAVVLRNSILPGVAALTCAPWLIQPLTGDLYDYGFTGTQYVLLVGLAIVLVIAEGAARHRRLNRSVSR